MTATAFAGDLTVFSNRIEASLHERHSLEQDMQLGLGRSEFYLQLQPQVNAQTFEIEGAEALCRWRHPSRGVVSPLKFIDLAEQNGFIHELGVWVIDQSCSILETLGDKGFSRMRISANVPPGNSPMGNGSTSPLSSLPRPGGLSCLNLRSLKARSWTIRTALSLS